MRDELRLHIRGTACEFCRTEFHEHGRLVRHVLCRVPRCRLYYEACTEPRTAEQQRDVESQTALAATRADPKALPLPACPASGAVV
eukprot:8133600-Alexandrium_andersonii.AAC.1